MAHLQKSKAAHLVWAPGYNPSDGSTWNLKWATDTWHSWPFSTAAHRSNHSEAPAATRSNINDSPAGVYSTAYSNVISYLTTANEGTLYQQAAVGGAYDYPGAPRASLWGYSMIATFSAPAAQINAARIACAYSCKCGLFTSWPSGSTLASKTLRSSVSGYLNFTSTEISTINAASAGTTLYFAVCSLPPSSYNGSLVQHEITNDGEEGDYYMGWWLEAGETLYWKTGYMSFPSQYQPNLTAFHVQY